MGIDHFSAPLFVADLVGAQLLSFSSNAVLLHQIVSQFGVVIVS